MDVLLPVLLWALLIGLYFLPYIVALHRHKRNSQAIGILNFLLGWTVIGWIVALIWATTQDATITPGNMPQKSMASTSEAEDSLSPNSFFFTKVTGVTHRNPDGSDRQKIISNCHVGERLALVREPTNPYDENAIKVCRESGELLGYLPAYIAIQLAAEMDSGVTCLAWVSDLTGGYDDHSTRGVNVKIEKVYEEQAAQPRT